MSELDQRRIARENLTRDFLAKGILGEIADMEACIDAYLRRDTKVARPADITRGWKRRDKIRKRL